MSSYPMYKMRRSIRYWHARNWWLIERVLDLLAALAIAAIVFVPVYFGWT